MWFHYLQHLEASTTDSSTAATSKGPVEIREKFNDSKKILTFICYEEYFISRRLQENLF